MSHITFIAGGTCGSAISPLANRKSRLTTSFGLVHGTVGIIIDNGFGVQNVVRHLKAAHVERVIVLQTHLHADHTDGLPQNAFFFQKEVPVEVFAPICEGANFRMVWEQRFASHVWPVRPEQFGALCIVHNLKENGQHPELPYWIRTFRLNHPGGALAYRIAHDNGDIVVATDHELGYEHNDRAYSEFVDGARVLVADVQYMSREYFGEIGIGGGPPIKRVGWGHSTEENFARTIAMCRRKPKYLMVTHHDPMRNQHDLDSFISVVVNQALNRHGVRSPALQLVDGKIHQL